MFIKLRTLLNVIRTFDYIRIVDFNDNDIYSDPVVYQGRLIAIPAEVVKKYSEYEVAEIVSRCVPERVGSRFYREGMVEIHITE